MFLENLKQRISNSKYPLLPLIWIVIFSFSALGEKFPIKHLTTADGLPQNSINSIAQDEKGFFWIGTNGGLARFDGYEFVNFTQREGLPRNEILDFLITRDNDFWLATRGGLVKFTPDGKIYNRVVTDDEIAGLGETPIFTTYRLPDSEIGSVTKLLQDSGGTIWIGTEKGVFKSLGNGGEIGFVPIDINLSLKANKYVYAIYEDRRRAVWIGTENNLTRISPDNRITNYRNAGEPVYYRAILEDRAGNFWVGTQNKGLFQFSIDGNETPFVVKQFAAQPDSEIEWIDAIRESADGKLWIGGGGGLHEFEPSKNILVQYTRTSGLNFYRFQTLFEDRAKNLWLGTRTNGIYRLSTRGLISFGTEDRISFVRAVGLDNEGDLILTAFRTNTELDEKGAKIGRDIAGRSVQAYYWRFGKLADGGFSWLVPKIPETIIQYGWGERQLSRQTRAGEWWIVTGEGLFRFPKVRFEDLDRTLPIGVFNKKSGLNSADIIRIYEDSRGNVWIATGSANGFYRWERGSETLRDMSVAEGFSAIKNNLISAFAEDRLGNLWLGFYDQGLARLRDGRIEFWSDKHGIPPGGVTGLFFDRENRLWLTTRQGGVLRSDDPEAAAPNFTNYTEADGLSSNRTLSVAEDRQGLIYFGTDRDISRLNPQTGEFRRLYLGKDQLQREYRSAICDKNGVLWFGTTEGLVKYVPTPDQPTKPPEVLITGALIESVPQKVPATGAAELYLPTLAPQQNQVRIDYVSLANFEDENIRYQYKFDDEEWSPPNAERFVNFANLSAGDYRICIRAVASGGVSSEFPAVVSFRILPPIYLRWWFFAASFTLFAAVVYAFYRTRLQKLLEMERARTLIATDLHDDIGANLSKISVLSEVVRMRMSDENPEQNRLLQSIAETSRASVSSMSDIVWAINPQRDSILEIIRKMRQHAEEVFAAENIRLKFIEPEASIKTKLPMHLRRDFYLIFKEAVNNVVKHSNCTTVVIDFQIKHQEINLKIEDDGRGFDASQPTNGNGLANMQSRVDKLKGTLEIESNINSGTALVIHIPQK